MQGHVSGLCQGERIYALPAGPIKKSITCRHRRMLKMMTFHTSMIPHGSNLPVTVAKVKADLTYRLISIAWL